MLPASSPTPKLCPRNGTTNAVALLYRAYSMLWVNLKFNENTDKDLFIGASGFRFHDCEFKSSNVTSHVIVNSNASWIVITDFTFRTSGVTKYDLDPADTDIYIDDTSINGEQGVSPGSSTYTLSSDTAFSHYPRVPITADAAIDSFSNWTTDANGSYTGVDVTFGTTPSNLSWEAIPRSVGL